MKYTKEEYIQQFDAALDNLEDARGAQAKQEAYDVLTNIVNEALDAGADIFEDPIVEEDYTCVYDIYNH